MQVHQLFPLTVIEDRLEIDEDERQALVKNIELCVSNSDSGRSAYAWTGDIHGAQFLFKDPLFNSLFTKISTKVLDYLALLQINAEKLNVYYQRAWATYSTHKQNIAFHTHAQSNISFAYYLKKPPQSGGLLFSGRDLQNEISKDIFGQDKRSLGLVKSINAHNAKQVLLDCKQDSIVIFPSKSAHATAPNLSSETRISISGDICLTLKDSSQVEHLLPDIKHWQQLG